MRGWTYSDLMDESSLVVIARPTATRALRATAALPNIREQDAKGRKHPVIARAAETDFTVVVVLKGKLSAAQRKSRSFTLLHYQELPPSKVTVNGPGLVAFDPGATRQYLMFLVRQADGRYTAVSGQTDPDQAIEALQLPSRP